ncbi:hypothetical protein LLG46_08930 [bacterium]|nr:hypothetical protein [bacterium]
MDTLTTQLKSFSKTAGADLIGIAPIERFGGIPAEHHPASIQPHVRSVIVIGKRITRGTLRGIEEGTQFDNYSLYGNVWLKLRVLATATFRVAEYIEDNGWEAVPIQDLPIETPPMGIAVRPDQPAPNVMVDVTDAAVRAGLGEIGYCGMFLTPEFGPRQRLQMILTTAELEPDDIFEGSVCSHCKEHVKFCPNGAISAEGEKTITICGKEMLVASIDDTKCRECKNGANPNCDYPAAKTERYGALCTRSCIDYLEKECRLTNKLNNPLRVRKPWAVVHQTRSLNPEYM